MFEASVHAVGRGAAAVVEEVPDTGPNLPRPAPSERGEKKGEYERYRNGLHQPVKCSLFVYRVAMYHEARFGWKNDWRSQIGVGSLGKLVPPAGFEPTAPGLGILCSIHLS